MVFFKVHPMCHNISNGIKRGRNSKKTDKHAADCSKAVCWGLNGKAKCLSLSGNIYALLLSSLIKPVASCVHEKIWYFEPYDQNLRNISFYIFINIYVKGIINSK